MSCRLNCASSSVHNTLQKSTDSQPNSPTTSKLFDDVNSIFMECLKFLLLSLHGLDVGEITVISQLCPQKNSVEIEVGLVGVHPKELKSVLKIPGLAKKITSINHFLRFGVYKLVKGKIQERIVLLADSRIGVWKEKEQFLSKSYSISFRLVTSLAVISDIEVLQFEEHMMCYLHNLHLCRPGIDLKFVNRNSDVVKHIHEDKASTGSSSICPEFRIAFDCSNYVDDAEDMDETLSFQFVKPRLLNVENSPFMQNLVLKVGVATIKIDNNFRKNRQLKLMVIAPFQMPVEHCSYRFDLSDCKWWRAFNLKLEACDDFEGKL